MSIAALFGLPDVAAEALLRDEAGRGAVIDKTQALDFLATQARGVPTRYADHMADFEADGPWFYVR